MEEHNGLPIVLKSEFLLWVTCSLNNVLKYIIIKVWNSHMSATSEQVILILYDATVFIYFERITGYGE